MKKDFSHLDDLIVARIRNGRTTFTAIHSSDDIERLAKPLGTVYWRVVDRRLQAMRKAGRVKFEKGNWSAP